MDYKKKIEIPFGAFDSELIHQEINIPNGFNAVIDGNKIILTRAESEDERIREQIVYAINKLNVPESEKNKLLAWFEKQGEKPVIEMKLPEESLGISSKEYNEIVNECLYGEQKPADRVEPKFRNGQWIVWQDKCYKVNYNGCGYELTDRNGFSTSLEYGTIDENAHLWDITKDAKDGDVLVNDEGKPFIFKGLLDAEHPNCPVAYGGVCINCYDVEEFCISERYRWWCDLIGVKPATKEQRDALIKAMADAGYEWDAERKELKEIVNKEQIKENLQDNSFRRMFEQKSSWGEEDEKIYNRLCGIVHNAAFANYDVDEVGKECGEYAKITEWLKSIKQRMGGELPAS
jgi:hypothetical protein